MLHKNTRRHTIPSRDEADARRGMAWFNGLTKAQRLRWLTLAKSTVPADAWALFKQLTGGAKVHRARRAHAPGV